MVIPSNTKSSFLVNNIIIWWGTSYPNIFIKFKYVSSSLLFIFPIPTTNMNTWGPGEVRAIAFRSWVRLSWLQTSGVSTTTNRRSKRWHVPYRHDFVMESYALDLSKAEHPKIVLAVAVFPDFLFPMRIILISSFSSAISSHALLIVSVSKYIIVHIIVFFQPSTCTLVRITYSTWSGKHYFDIKFVNYTSTFVVISTRLSPKLYMNYRQ